MPVETRHSTSTAITAAVATVSPRRPGQRLADFFTLCKPRVNSLIVFTAMIGMFLASPAFPPIGLFLTASVGIALVAGAAAAIYAARKGINTGVLAERFGADSGRIARIIMAATALSFFSLTAAVWLLGVGPSGS